MVTTKKPMVVVRVRVMPCGCKSEAQDERYGAHNRQFKWDDLYEAWRCTGCRTLKGRD